LVGHSRQPRWGVGSLVEMALALGHADGLAPVFDLLEAGLLLPDLGPALATAKVKNFAEWVAHPAGAALAAFSPPQIAARAVAGVREEARSASEALSLAPAPGPRPPAPGVLEADGLEWLLRLGVLWQQAAVPLRRTLGGGFFKRDAERLGQDHLLNAP